MSWIKNGPLYIVSRMQLLATIAVAVVVWFFLGGNALKQSNYENLQQLIMELNQTKQIILTGELEDVDR